VQLTEAGEAAFRRLRDAAAGFDGRLRDGLTEADLDTLGALLGRLSGNVAPGAGGGLPWAGLAEAAP
jgi:MarR family transcriptional regulator for hemolysin